MQKAWNYLVLHWLDLWSVRLSQEQFEKTYESNLKDNLTAGGKKYLFRKINQVESDNSFETIKKQTLGNGDVDQRATPFLCYLR